MINRRVLIRFVVAVVFASAIVGLRAMSPPALNWTLPATVKVGEGRILNLPSVSPVPSNFTFTAVSVNAYGQEGLPPGIVFDQALGVFSGQLATGVPGTDRMHSGAAYVGAEGIYTVTVNAYDNGVFQESKTFIADVGRWITGDVFAGVGKFVYAVYSETGEFKYDVTLPEDAGGDHAGSTPGCAVDWKTREVWAANYDSILPGVQVITRQADGGTEVGGAQNLLPYTSPSRRVSTARYLIDGNGNPYLNPASINPESVAFDNAQNMYVGHSFGFLNNAGDTADKFGRPVLLNGVYVDAAGALILALNPDTGVPGPLYYDTWISPDGYFENWVDTGGPDVNGVYVANWARSYFYSAPGNNPLDRIQAPHQAGLSIHKYQLTNGRYPFLDGLADKYFDVRYNYTGPGALDLMRDQQTMIYSAEDQYLYKYDIAGNGAQLPVVGSEGDPTYLQPPLRDFATAALRRPCAAAW